MKIRGSELVQQVDQSSYSSLEHIWTSQNLRLSRQNQQCPKPYKKVTQNSGSRFQDDEVLTCCTSPCNVRFVYYVAEDRFQYDQYRVQQIGRSERGGSIWKKLRKVMPWRVNIRIRSTRQRGLNAGSRCRLGRFKVRTVDAGEVIVNPTNQLPPATNK